MKLTLNAEELLALYNALYERFGIDKGLMDESPETHDTQELRGLYRRIRDHVLDALAPQKSQSLDPVSFDKWLVAEQLKIDELKKQNSKITSQLTEPYEPLNECGPDKCPRPSSPGYSDPAVPSWLKKYCGKNARCKK